MDVDGLTPSSVGTLRYGIFFVLAIVLEDFAELLLICILTRNGTKYLFSACKLIFYFLLPMLQSENFLKMWLSPDEMQKKYDYQMKEKVVQEEKQSWGRLCSKLVSNNTPNTPFMGSFYVFETILDVGSKIVKNCKKS